MSLKCADVTQLPVSTADVELLCESDTDDSSSTLSAESCPSLSSQPSCSVATSSHLKSLHISGDAERLESLPSQAVHHSKQNRCIDCATGWPSERWAWSQVDVAPRGASSPSAPEISTKQDDGASRQCHPASNYGASDGTAAGMSADVGGTGGNIDAASGAVMKKAGKCADCNKQCTKNWFECASHWSQQRVKTRPDFCMGPCKIEATYEGNFEFVLPDCFPLKVLSKCSVLPSEKAVVLRLCCPDARSPGAPPCLCWQHTSAIPQQ
jgi:hypothetical protein